VTLGFHGTMKLWEDRYALLPGNGISHSSIQVLEFNTSYTCTPDHTPSHYIPNWQSRPEAYCRQSAGTITPGIGPRWDPWPYFSFGFSPLFFFLSSLVLLKDKRSGWSFLFEFFSGVHLLHLIGVIMWCILFFYTLHNTWCVQKVSIRIFSA
jgi:hypothetical protein